METELTAEDFYQAGEDHSILREIGNTPLIKLHSLSDSLANNVSLFGKAEWMNPSGSVKVRPALGMILHAIKSGVLTKEKTILDATSGNTGIAYATIAGALDYEVTLCVPENVSSERKGILEGLGADLVLTRPEEQIDGAIEKARELKQQRPDVYFYPDQYNNEQNWKAHYLTTGPEIYSQTDEKISHFVAGLGTTGTFVGTSRYLQEQNPDIKKISFEPDSRLHGLEGLKHLNSSIVPGIYVDAISDENHSVSTEKAYRMMHRLAKEEGVFVGPSGAAAVRVAFRVASDLTRGTVVTILPDSGDKYMDFWTG